MAMFIDSHGRLAHMSSACSSTSEEDTETLGQDPVCMRTKKERTSMHVLGRKKMRDFCALMIKDTS